MRKQCDKIFETHDYFLVEIQAYLKTNKLEFNEIIISTKKFTREAGALLKEVIQKQMKHFFTSGRSSKQLINSFIYLLFSLAGRQALSSLSVFSFWFTET